MTAGQPGIGDASHVYALDCFSAPSLHQHCRGRGGTALTFEVGIIKGSSSGLSQGHTTPAAPGSFMTVWGPPSRAPGTRKHL